MNMWKQFKPQDEDSYLKSEFEFCEIPESISQQIVWDFSHVIATGKQTEVRWRNLGDSILVVVENDTQRTYQCSNDTIYQCAIENRLLRLVDSISPISLFLPAGQTEVTTPYSENGYYSNLIPIRTRGTQQLLFEAIGTLILPSDTLYNVILLRQNRIGTIEVDKDNDENLIQWSDSLLSVKEDICRWYAPGIRYPIVERIIKSYDYNHLGLRNYQALFVCSPEQNMGQQSILTEPRAINPTVRNGNESLELGKDVLISQSDTDIQIQLNSSPTSSGLVVLSDIQGRVWNYQALNSDHTLYITTSSLAAGNYILTLQVDGNNMSKRIIVE